MNLEIFTAQGTKPLNQLMKMSCPRLVKREYDKACRSNVLVLEGTTPTQCNVQFQTALLSSTPVLMVQLNCNPGDILIELGCVDGNGTKRRVSLTNNVKSVVTDCLHTRLPLAGLPRGVWCNLYIHTGVLLERYGFRGIEKIALGPALKLRRLFALKDIPIDIPRGAEFPPTVHSETVVITNGMECVPTPSPTPAREPKSKEKKEILVAFGRRIPIVTPRSEHELRTSVHEDSLAGIVAMSAPLVTPREVEAPNSVLSSPGLVVEQTHELTCRQPHKKEPLTEPKPQSPGTQQQSDLKKGYDPARYNELSIQHDPGESPLTKKDMNPSNTSSIHTSIPDAPVRASEAFSVRTASSCPSQDLHSLRDAIHYDSRAECVRSLTRIAAPAVADSITDPMESSLNFYSVDVGPHMDPRLSQTDRMKSQSFKSALVNEVPWKTTESMKEHLQRNNELPLTAPSDVQNSMVDDMTSNAFVVQYCDPPGEEPNIEPICELPPTNILKLSSALSGRYEGNEDASPDDDVPAPLEGSEATEDIVPSSTTEAMYEEEREEEASVITDGEYSAVDQADAVARHLNFSGDTTVYSVDPSVARELQYSVSLVDYYSSNSLQENMRYGGTSTSRVFDHVLGMYYNPSTNTYQIE